MSNQKYYLCSTSVFSDCNTFDKCSNVKYDFKFIKKIKQTQILLVRGIKSHSKLSHRIYFTVYHSETIYFGVSIISFIVSIYHSIICQSDDLLRNLQMFLKELKMQDL